MSRSAVAANFDEICRLRAAGKTLVESLRAVGVGKSNFEGYLRRHPELRARYAAATPVDGMALVAERFDSILAAVAAGAAVKKAITDHGCLDTSFYKHIRRNPALRARLVAATERRELPGRRASLDPQRRWTEAEYDAALETISNARGGIVHALEGLPGTFALYGRARRNAEFRDRLRAVMRERFRRSEAARRPPSPTAPWGHLQRALLHDEIYRAARKVTRGFDPNDRDDVISELYLAALEDEFGASEFRASRMTALKRARGHQLRFMSLDAPISGSRNADNVGDEIASPSPILHW